MTDRPQSTAPEGQTGHLDQDDTMLINAERMTTGTSWIVSGTLRLRREIRTETRMLEVLVRREILTVDYNEAVGTVGTGHADQAVEATEPPAERPPVVLVLHEEQPEVIMRSEPYEIVTARFSRARTERTIRDYLRHEDVIFEVTPGVPIRQGTEAGTAAQHR
jgi:stress response protein YsnF